MNQVDVIIQELIIGNKHVVKRIYLRTTILVLLCGVPVFREESNYPSGGAFNVICIDICITFSQAF